MALSGQAPGAFATWKVALPSLALPSACRSDRISTFEHGRHAELSNGVNILTLWDASIDALIYANTRRSFRPGAFLGAALDHRKSTFDPDAPFPQTRTWTNFGPIVGLESEWAISRTLHLVARSSYSYVENTNRLHTQVAIVIRPDGVIFFSATGNYETIRVDVSLSAAVGFTF